MASSTSTDPEVSIRQVTPSNSRIQFMLDQEDDPYFYNKCLTSDDWLTTFSDLGSRLYRGLKQQKHYMFKDHNV